MLLKKCLFVIAILIFLVFLYSCIARKDTHKIPVRFNDAAVNEISGTVHYAENEYFYVSIKNGSEHTLKIENYGTLYAYNGEKWEKVVFSAPKNSSIMGEEYFIRPGSEREQITIPYAYKTILPAGEYRISFDAKWDDGGDRFTIVADFTIK